MLSFREAQTVFLTANDRASRHWTSGAYQALLSDMHTGPEDAELIQHLYSKLSSVLEDALQLSLDGQAARPTLKRALSRTKRLQAALRAANCLSDALTVLTGQAIGNRHPD